MEDQHWLLEYVAPYVNFIIFVGILVYFARKPLAQLATKRKASFEAHFKAASEALAQAKHQLDEIQKRYSRLDEEIGALRKRAQTDAQHEAEKIISEGKRLAEQIVLDAKRMRDSEYLEAKKQLEREALSVARAVIIDKLQRDFSEAKDRSFVEGRIQELSKINASAMRGF